MAIQVPPEARASPPKPATCSRERNLGKPEVSTPTPPTSHPPLLAVATKGHPTVADPLTITCPKCQRSIRPGEDPWKLRTFCDRSGQLATISHRRVSLAQNAWQTAQTGSAELEIIPQGRGVRILSKPGSFLRKKTTEINHGSSLRGAGQLGSRGIESGRLHCNPFG